MSPLILLVDDDALALGVRRLVLEAARYEVLTASNASKALGLVSVQRFDLVITDNTVTKSGQDLGIRTQTAAAQASGHNTFWWFDSKARVPAARLFSAQTGWTGRNAGEGFVCDSLFDPGLIQSLPSHLCSHPARSTESLQAFLLSPFATTNKEVGKRERVGSPPARNPCGSTQPEDYSGALACKTAVFCAIKLPLQVGTFNTDRNSTHRKCVRAQLWS